MKSDILIFSIALNGYQWLYRDCIASHHRYAKKNGYCYQVVSRPFITTLGAECCWLKLSLTLSAFNAGYHKVLFVDADAYINEAAPAIEKTIRPEKYVYLAKSYTGRFNSGVMFMLNNEETITWLKKILSSRMTSVSDKDSVGWGENGHIIKYSKNRSFIEIIDRRWNNTYDPDLDDYIRHFCFGPLRQNIVLSLCHKVISRITKAISKSKNIASKYTLHTQKTDPLTTLTNVVIKQYPRFEEY
ncbi:MAG: hypothetical protein ACJAUL_001745 [Paraglaciecola sp.]|jgi:hypothetical protein